MSQHVALLDAVTRPQYGDQPRDGDHFAGVGGPSSKLPTSAIPIPCWLCSSSPAWAPGAAAASGKSARFRRPPCRCRCRSRSDSQSPPGVAVAVAPLQVGRIDTFHAAVRRGGVVDHNPGPIPWRNAGPPGIDCEGRKAKRVRGRRLERLRSRRQYRSMAEHTGLGRFDVRWKRCRRHPSWLKAADQAQLVAAVSPRIPNPLSATPCSHPWEFADPWPRRKQILCFNGIGAGMYRGAESVSTRTHEPEATENGHCPDRAKGQRNRPIFAEANDDLSREVCPLSGSRPHRTSRPNR